MRESVFVCPGAPRVSVPSTTDTPENPCVGLSPLGPMFSRAVSLGLPCVISLLAMFGWANRSVPGPVLMNEPEVLLIQPIRVRSEPSSVRMIAARF